MSNIAGKAYAMNVITPIRWYTAWVNKLIFLRGTPGTWLNKLADRYEKTIWRLRGEKGDPPENGLVTLSLIHYASWIVIARTKFPHLGQGQPREKLKYAYMLFFSNFNGSWDQYVDSFTFAIPEGLDLFWFWNVKYPKSVPVTPFKNYIRYNQIETDHYYNAYPMAASNDVKSAQNVKSELIEFAKRTATGTSPEEFSNQYRQLLGGLQYDLGLMGPNPVVSLAAEAVERRRQQAG
jgi:hypothetical protein